MRSKIFWISSILCFIFFCLNYYARKHLPGSYATQLTYDQLYLTDSTLYVKQVTVDNENTLNLELGGASSLLDNIEIVDTAGNILPSHQNIYKLSAKSGISWYIIKDKHTLTTIDSFRINYTTAEEYSRNGHLAPSDFELLNLNLPIVSSPIQPISTWAQPGIEEYQDKNQRNWDRLFSDTLKIIKSDNSFDKLEKNLTYIFSITDGHLGFPADSLSAIHPYDFLQAVKNGKTRLWCGNFTSIFTWLCQSEGINTRVVATANTSKISLGNHTFCEIFIPEIRKWIFSDPTNHLAYIRKGNYYFNTIDFWRLLKMKEKDSAVICGLFENARLKETPLDAVNNEYRRFYNENNQVWFYYANYLKNQNDHSLSKRFSNIIFAAPNYAFYTDTAIDFRLQFYVRMISGYLFVTALLATILTGLNYLRGGKNKRYRKSNQ